MQKENIQLSDILISFCIPVYNQCVLVKECINSITEYKGNDIEVVISDDNSTEKIDELIRKIGDKRIHYYKNTVNIGHDRNILKALERANGKYAFVLRTRDRIIASNIPRLLDIARLDCYSYITACALDQYGRVRLPYRERRYKKGKEALYIHFDLFIHPSGNMYRLRELNIEELTAFLDAHKVSKTGFIVHNMIRIALAEKGDFYTLSTPQWIYTYTLEQNDRAVNHTENKVSVYDPKLNLKRFQYEFEWAKQVVSSKNIYNTCLCLIALYLNSLTWGFKLVNSDHRAQYHYRFNKVKFSMLAESRQMWKSCLEIYDECFRVSQKKYRSDLRRIFIKNYTVGAIKFIIKKITVNTPIYNSASAVYKKYIKRL